MRVTSRWTKWDLQEDDLQTGILQYKDGIPTLGSSSINMESYTGILQYKYGILKLGSSSINMELQNWDPPV